MPLSKGPHRLKKPPKNGVLVNFPFQLRVLGWWYEGSPTAQLASWPSDLNASLGPSVPWAAWFCQGNQGRRGDSKALAWEAGHVGCTDSSNKKSAKDIPGSPVEIRPQNTHRGTHEPFGGLFWGLLGRASESKFPRTSSNLRTLKDRAGQGRKAQSPTPRRATSR